MSTQLSSETLEQQFGETKIIILEQNEKYRIIKTISTVGDEVLELSLVTFDQDNVKAFPEVHEAIIRGTSIGKAYRQAGVQFNREVTSFTSTLLPDKLSSHFAAKGLATVIEVDILVGADQVHYCHILEIYSPTVQWPQRDKPASPIIDELLSGFLKLL